MDLPNIQIWEGFKNDIFNLGVQVSATCAIIAGTFFFVPVGYAVFSGAFSRDGAPNSGMIYRAAGVLILLLTYPIWMELLNSVIAVILELLPHEDNILVSLYKYSRFLPDDKELKDANLLQKAVLYVTQAGSAIKAAFLKFIIGGGMSLIRMIYQLLASMIICFLYVGGPVALLLSMFPPFEEVGNKWFKGYMIINLWFITMNILDSMFVRLWPHYSVSEAMTDAATEGLVDAAKQSALIVVNLVILLCYLIIPTLTSVLFYQSTSNNTISKLVSTTAMVAYASAQMAGMLPAMSTGNAATSGGTSGPQTGGNWYHPGTSDYGNPKLYAGGGIDVGRTNAGWIGEDTSGAGNRSYGNFTRNILL